MIGTNEIRVLLLLLGLTVLRLLLGAFTELSPDEAYYLLWAERLDWSYYSKGPGVAVALWITTGLFGETEFGVRCLSPVLGFGTSVLMYLLGKRTVGRDAALWAVVIFNLTPIFNAGSILLTIDPLMMFFWSASLLCYWMALERSWNREWGWWAATGLCLALGFLCKYTIIVVFVTILLHLGLSRRRRVHLKRPGFYLMTGILLLGSLPILIWNAQHGWITFVHLIERTGLFDSSPNGAVPSADFEFPLRPGDFATYLGMHLGVYSPVLFTGLLAALWLGIRRLRDSEGELFLGLFSIPLIFFYFFLSWFNAGEVNWTVPGFVTLGLLAMKYWREWSWKESRKRWIALVACVWSIGMTLWAVNPDTPRTVGVSWPYQRDPFLRLRGWDTAAGEVNKVVERITKEQGQKPFLLASRYQTAAALAFYGDFDVFRPSRRYLEVGGRVSEGGKIRNQFSFWPNHEQPKSAEDWQGFQGRAAVYVSDDLRINIPSDIKDHFSKAQHLHTFEVERRGRMARTWNLFLLSDFQSEPPTPNLKH